MRRATLALLAAGALGATGCGGAGASGGAGGATPPRTVELARETGSDSRFDPGVIYDRDAPSVVTVKSIFPRAGGGLLGGGGVQEGVGSGFVVSRGGEVATNAHVVTMGGAGARATAKEVYVRFGDGNEVGAKVVGFDPNADVALLRIPPAGLRLRPLALGSSAKLRVGEPVAAIGSPFGEEQENSLSTGIISGTNRTIDSLTNFRISGAVQTDAAINHGNSGGPLVDAGGRVLGINSQIRSTGGGGEGVGFAVPVDLVRRSLDQLRRSGHVSYAYLGVSTAPVYPQLARRFKLPVAAGSWVQKVTPGGPAARAGVHAGTATAVFHAQQFVEGGDVITKVAGTPVLRDSDLSDALAHFKPGQKVALEVHRGSQVKTVEVTLTDRPASSPRESP